MRFSPSIFASLLKPIDRRVFRELVRQHDADAYDKRFRSWHHLVTLLFAQFTGAQSLRGIESGFNALGNQHYHLGCGPVARTTLADANVRRPAALFGAVFGALAGSLGRKARHDSGAVLRLIDSSPIPLAEYFDCGRSNGRTRGFKLHVVHGHEDHLPRQAAITPANVNDISFGRGIAIEAGTTYVFDKGYCHFGWWSQIAAKGAVFVTRPKTNMRWKTLRRRTIDNARGEDFRLLYDREVRLDSKGDSKLPIFLRRITIRRSNGEVFDIITNDDTRSALELALCYKARWQIELFFKWTKQNLNIKRFIGRNENAIRLQILAAMIAYLLLSLARRLSSTPISTQRFAELVASFLHSRRRIDRIDKPPPTNPAKPTINPNQLKLTYA